jgi:UDP-glucose 4-epimerase
MMFNVAMGNRVTLNETVEILRKITGYSGPVNHAAERTGDVKHSLADINAAKQAFGYEPSVSFEEGLRRTVDWYRKTVDTVPTAAGQREKA